MKIVKWCYNIQQLIYLLKKNLYEKKIDRWVRSGRKKKNNSSKKLPQNYISIEKRQIRLKTKTQSYRSKADGYDG